MNQSPGTQFFVIFLLGLGIITPNKVKAQSQANLVASLCQSSIRLQLLSDRGSEGDIDFEPPTRFTVSPLEEGIRGRARSRIGQSWQTFTYDCVVNTQTGLITRVNHDFSGVSASERLCQSELQAEVQKDSGRPVKFTDPASRRSISRSREELRGTALLEARRGTWQTHAYDCTVNLETNSVVRLTYRPIDSDRPNSNDRQLVSRCQDAIRKNIAENRINIGGLFDLALQSGKNIDFLEGARVQSLEEGKERVLGEAIVSQGSRQSRVNYECTTQNGEISSANIK